DADADADADDDGDEGDAAAEADLVDTGGNAPLDPRTTLEGLEPKPVEEPDAPVLREARDPEEVVTKTVNRDEEPMATRRGRRRRGGRGGARREDIEADAKADETGGAAAGDAPKGERTSSWPPAPAENKGESRPTEARPAE